MNAPLPFPWPEGRRCAVSLTYDDAVACHYEAVAPLLAEKGLPGTFYLTANASVTDTPERWAQVAAMGHELGNHSLFHPCRREPLEKSAWIQPHYDLCEYTAQRWFDELRIANGLLHLIDGRSERTYAHTCGNLTIGRGPHEISMDKIVMQLCVAGRGKGAPDGVDPRQPNYAALGCFGGDRKTGAELIQRVESIRETGRWLIFICHGVGAGTHNHYIDTAEHRVLVDWLAARREQIWVAPVVQIAKYLQQQR